MNATSLDVEWWYRQHRTIILTSYEGSSLDFENYLRWLFNYSSETSPRRIEYLPVTDVSTTLDSLDVQDIYFSLRDLFRSTASPILDQNDGEAIYDLEGLLCGFEKLT